MKFPHPTIKILSLAAAACVLGGCSALKSIEVTHVPPGESINVALAKKPELVRLPAPLPLAPDPSAKVSAAAPALPEDSTVERVAEAYSRGEFCLGAGKDEEAISAFEEAVKIDPAFTEAWQQLAFLYEKKGNSKKAMEAFRRAKKVAVQ